MEMNPVIIKHLSKADPVLKNIIKHLSLEAIPSTCNVFHDLMSCILEQQIHYRSTKKTFEKMLTKAGLKRLTIENFEQFEKDGIADAKMSINKYETISRILDFFEGNSLDWPSLSDEEVRKTLGQIKGVGPWTIDMILIFTLGRANVFTADDYHLKQIMNALYSVDTTARIKAQHKAIAEKWSPYKSYAVRYLLEWKNYQKREQK